MIVLAFDTATPDTVVALQTRPDGEVRERRQGPAPGRRAPRPAHAQALLGLAHALLAEQELTFAEVGRIGVGVGPGTFTGLRIGVATGRALAQAGTAELVAVPTLEALARGADPAAGPVLACLDARRGEAFAAAWGPRGPLAAAVAVAPEGLGGLLDPAQGGWHAVGDGAVAFRAVLEAAGATVPADADARHHVGGSALCALTRAGTPVARDKLEPDYVRAPDARPRQPA